MAERHSFFTADSGGGAANAKEAGGNGHFVQATDAAHEIDEILAASPTTLESLHDLGLVLDDNQQLFGQEVALSAEILSTPEQVVQLDHSYSQPPSADPSPVQASDAPKSRPSKKAKKSTGPTPEHESKSTARAPASTPTAAPTAPRRARTLATPKNVIVTTPKAAGVTKEMTSGTIESALTPQQLDVVNAAVARLSSSGDAEMADFKRQEDKPSEDANNEQVSSSRRPSRKSKEKFQRNLERKRQMGKNIEDYVTDESDDEAPKAKQAKKSLQSPQQQVKQSPQRQNASQNQRSGGGPRDATPAKSRPSGGDVHASRNSNSNKTARSSGGSSAKRSLNKGQLVDAPMDSSTGEVSNEDGAGDDEWNSDNDPEKLWCICRKPHNNQFMIACDLCENWYHGKCVGVSKNEGARMEKAGQEWYCTNCRRKRNGLPTSRSNLSVPLIDSVSPNMPAVMVGNYTVLGQCAHCKQVVPSEPTHRFCNRECTTRHVNKYLPGIMERAERDGLEVRVSMVEISTGKAINLVNAAVNGTIDWLCRKPTFQINPNQASAIRRPVPKQPGSTPQPQQGLSPKDSSGGGAASGQPKTPQNHTRGGSRHQTHSSPRNAVITDNGGSPGHAVRGSGGGRNAQSAAQEKPVVAKKSPPVVSHANRRKSSTGAAGATGAGDTNNGVAKELPADTEVRRTAVNTLCRVIRQRCEQQKDFADKAEQAESLAKGIEEALFKFCEGVTKNYKLKFRSLSFNMKDPKNELWRRVVQGEIEPQNLVRMGANELSTEMARWREREAQHNLELYKKEAAINVTDKDTLRLLAEAAPSSDANATSGRRSTSHSAGQKSTTAKKSSTPVTSPEASKEAPSGRQTRKMTAAREKRQEQEKSKDSSKDSPTKTKESPKSAKAEKSPATPTAAAANVDKMDLRGLDRAQRIIDQVKEIERRKSSVDDIPLGDLPVGDQEALQHPDSSSEPSPEISSIEPSGPSASTELPTSPPESTEAPVPMDTSDEVSTWSGVIRMEAARFVGNLCHVGGPANEFELGLPDTVVICGKIQPAGVKDYLRRLKHANKDIVVVRISAEPSLPQNAIEIADICQKLKARSRLGVVEEMKQTTVKDFYMLPLDAGERAPEWFPYRDEICPNGAVCLLGLVICHRKTAPRREMRSTTAAATAVTYQPSPVVKQVDNIATSIEEAERALDKDMRPLRTTGGDPIAGVGQQLQAPPFLGSGESSLSVLSSIAAQQGTGNEDEAYDPEAEWA